METYYCGKYEGLTLKQISKAARNVFNAIPADVIRDMAMREFNMSESTQCVCGWAFRAGVEKLKAGGFDILADSLSKKYLAGGTNADSPDTRTDEGCVLMFKTATPKEWEIVYYGVTGTGDGDPVFQAIELEFVRRLEKAVTEV
jgi:hypothetical protein